jgi:hypothetical protein
LVVLPRFSQERPRGKPHSLANRPTPVESLTASGPFFSARAPFAARVPSVRLSSIESPAPFGEKSKKFHVTSMTRRNGRKSLLFARIFA